ncbi:IS3 family transposase [Actinomycetaceae bacterium MB13-C1-2]|nr:IS3 family transposase [Actinomycetaceae bacterium MB13-C1-2]WRS31084.1 IS3 family transposase [Actinomycetaceae bacterium MB13-C1-2]
MVLLDVAGLARSTFYYHLARLDGADPHAELKAAVEEIFEHNKSRYGHRRIHIELRKQGWQVAKKTVLKTMQVLGLKPKTRSRKRFSSYKGNVGKIAPNLLNRQFFADRPNEKWVTDVTEFKVREAKLYLSPVLDLCDRSIVAFATSQHPTVEFAVSSLRDALEQLPEHASLLVHSDQGFHYQHAHWQQCLAMAGAAQSMSRKGNCLDNAVMENFFGHLKEEMFHHDSFDSIEDLEAEIHAYIAWYNTERVSLTLEGMSPMEYRAHALAA